jgi:peptide/nickel transport system permease protein
MGSYLVRRILEAIPTLIVVSLVVFFLHRLLPGDILDQMAGSAGGDADLTRVKALLGLDKPAHVAYLEWLTGLLTGNLGISLLSRTPISGEIAWRWPVTVELTLVAMLFTTFLGIPIGIVAGLRQESWADYVLRSLAVLGLSLPTFWIGVMAVTLPSIYLGIIPRQDYVSLAADPIRNIGIFLLPGFILSVHYVARIARMTRGTLLEVLRQDYIRTAWAKGLRESVVVTRHAMRNALNPVVTLLGLEFINLLAGTVVIERVFDLPGIGNYTLQALNFRDYPTVQSIIFLYAIIVIAGTLIIDLSYRWLDPRVKYD